METLRIRGGNKLFGDVEISAAKNALLPIIAATLLTSDDVQLNNCAPLSDVLSMLTIINTMGGKAVLEGKNININCASVTPTLIDPCLTGGIRSSVFILGPILARFKHAVVNYPGGCEIGLRPIDLHIYGLKRLGVKIDEHNGHICCDGTGMHAAEVDFDFPSVGATENIMMAAVSLNGKTVIRNAAREPEIKDLADFINKMGGRIYGAGSDTIVIDGVERLHGCEYTPIPDRIIAGTYLCACAMTGGDVSVNVSPSILRAVCDRLGRMGFKLRLTPNSIRLTATRRPRAVHKIETMPYPGFPTDMQAQTVALLSIADGCSMMVENLFESRFRYTAELNKMGANITVKDRVAVIKGVKSLRSACVTAQDLRGGAALCIAALAAEGETVIASPHHIDRGYAGIECDLCALGGDVRRVGY